MFQNYLKIALRHLSAHRGHSAINIAGLALGLTCSLLIYLWVADERGIDHFHQNGDRLYTLYTQMFFDGKKVAGYGTPGPLPTELERRLPEVEAASGFSYNSINTFRAGNKTIKEEGNAASPAFFRMFSYPLLAGSATEALAMHESIAISASMATAFWGSPAAAIGQTIRYENKKDLTVKAVYADIPATSSWHFDFLLNWDYYIHETGWMLDMGNLGPSTYVLLKKGTDPAAFARKITHFYDLYADPNSKKETRSMLGMEPYRDVYLHGHFEEHHLSGGRIEYVELFSLVAIAILLIACINFMNLTTARSLRRAKEIGVRKVMGAVRGLLIRQFIGEAMLMSLVSAALALLLTAILLPAFNELTAKHIAFPGYNPSFWAAFLGLALLTGVLSGSYPALYLSSFSPIRVLKGATPAGGRSGLFRKVLVVFQFVLSIVLIVSTLLIARQVRYVQDVNLGYDRENLLYVPIEGDLMPKKDVFIQEALRSPGISRVSMISQSPTNIENGTINVQWEGKDPNATPMFTQAAVGYDFTRTMGLQIASGRDFSRSFPTDSDSYLINEAAAKIIGYKDLVGRSLSQWGRQGKIIGVLKDFHYMSLHTEIKPIIFRLGYRENYFFWFLVRTQPGKTREALTSLRSLCGQLNPAFPFSYLFSDEEYAKQYANEALEGKLAIVFSLLAVLISCLGLLGLSVFAAEQRTREISIRKVLGASVASLFGLVSGEFLALVGLACAMAIPLSWWAMHSWLQHFAYRTPISWWVFALAGLAAVLVALATISYQALRVARANPARTLRAE